MPLQPGDCAAIDMTPEPVRSLPQLRGRGLRFGEALLATSLPLRDTPPAQSARRLKAARPV